MFAQPEGMSGSFLSTCSRLRVQGHLPLNSRRKLPPFPAYHGPDCTAKLPDEILLSVLGYLDARSLDNCLTVSRRWHQQCSTAMTNRGPRHIRLLFEIVGGDTEDGEMDIYWLFKNDSNEVVKSILVNVCSTYRLARLASIDRSFEGSFESEVVALLKGDSQAMMAVQLRTSSYLDTLNRPERELTNLVIRPPNILNAMIDGVITKIATQFLQEMTPQQRGATELSHTDISSLDVGHFNSTFNRF